MSLVVDAALGVGGDCPETILEFLSDLLGQAILAATGACAYDLRCENAGSSNKEHFEEIKKRFAKV